jgi:hypothetical protein
MKYPADSRRRFGRSPAGTKIPLRGWPPNGTRQTGPGDMPNAGRLAAL